jgi:hypothetical protein
LNQVVDVSRHSFQHSSTSYSTFFQGSFRTAARWPTGLSYGTSYSHGGVAPRNARARTGSRTRTRSDPLSSLHALSVGPGPESAVSGTRACRLLTVTRSHLPPPVPDTCHTSRAKTTATDRESLRIVDRPVECVAVRRPPSDSRPHGPHLFDVLIPQCRQPRQRVRC